MNIVAPRYDARDRNVVSETRNSHPTSDTLQWKPRRVRCA
jgi:hypothetical protein